MAEKHSLLGVVGGESAIYFKDMRGNNDMSKMVYGGESIALPVQISQYRDSFTSNWNNTNTLGRMDPIYTYKNTERTITFTLTVANRTFSDAKYTQDAVAALIRMTYPNYDTAGSDNSLLASLGMMTTPPIVGIKMGNIIADSRTGGFLAGVLGSIEYAPADDNFIVANGSKIQYLPKLVNIGINFKPIHLHALGYSEQGIPRSGFESFPFPSGDFKFLMNSLNFHHEGTAAGDPKNVKGKESKAKTDAALNPQAQGKK